MSQLECARSTKYQRAAKIPTKVVVRRLPPHFTEAILKEQISPIPDYNYFYFVKSDKADGVNSFSRAYINFVSSNDVFVFKEKYDAYVFLGLKGTEYPAVVEFAPFQKIPKHRLHQKRDAKCGTIQGNEYYLQFINSLKASKHKPLDRPEYDLQLNVHLNRTEDITPLLKYVSARRYEHVRNLQDKKKERQHRNESTVVFVNSSVRKTANRRMYLKRYLP